MMTVNQEAKIQKLLDLLEESRVIIQRMDLTCQQIEKELRMALNDNLPISNNGN